MLLSWKFKLKELIEFELTFPEINFGFSYDKKRPFFLVLRIFLFTTVYEWD